MRSRWWEGGDARFWVMEVKRRVVEARLGSLLSAWRIASTGRWFGMERLLWREALPEWRKWMYKYPQRTFLALTGCGRGLRAWGNLAVRV